jgi:hypothetical protein
MALICKYPQKQTILTMLERSRIVCVVCIGKIYVFFNVKTLQGATSDGQLAEQSNDQFGNLK